MKLMFLNGSRTGQMIELPPEGVTIGRENDNAIQLPMGGVSRYHAKIERDASGNWQIRDLGSTNGTLVNDIPVDGIALLFSGSVISIGDQLLRCIDPDAEVSPVPEPAASVPPGPQAQPQPAPAPIVPPANASAPTLAGFVVPQANASAPHDPSISQTFFFRPQNVTAKSATSGTGPVLKPPKADPKPSSPASNSNPADIGYLPPTDASVPTEVPRGLFKKKSDKPQKPGKVVHDMKMLGNVLFVLLLFLAVGIVVGLWLDFGKKPAPAPAPTKKRVENPFVLYYEKETAAGTSVFRFTLLLENGKMEVTLDEPQNKRSYYELFQEPVSDELIAKLRQQIQDSGFMELQQEQITGTSMDNRQHRRIMVGFSNKFCDVSVSNDVSETFNRVESIINETLLDEYDLGVISQDVDRILKDAASFLFVAEEAFRSIDTTPSNLPKAITNYKLALRRYQLFSPEPPELKTARDGLAKAEAQLEKIHDEGLKNVRLAYELRDYDKAIAECNRLLEIFPPDSKTYKDIRETKIKIDSKRSIRNN
jgi:tetratricopeptide (TPR) repeat protein